LEILSFGKVIEGVDEGFDAGVGVGVATAGAVAGVLVTASAGASVLFIAPDVEEVSEAFGVVLEIPCVCNGETVAVPWFSTGAFAQPVTSIMKIKNRANTFLSDFIFLPRKIKRFDYAFIISREHLYFNMQN
jgi:hypothetical protein